MSKLKSKFNYPPYLDKIIFLGATSYLIIVGAWFFRGYRESIAINTQPEMLDNQNEQMNLVSEDDSNLFSADVFSVINPGEIPPLPVNTELIPLNPPDSISPLPIPTPPPLPTATPVISPPIYVDEQVKIPSQNAQSLPTPPPPKPVTQKPPTSVPILEPPSATNSNNHSSNSIIAKATPESQKQYSLVGVIELPNDSNIALFNINNLTERVNVGSAIASTGWTLMSIYNNEVVISRNNQSLSLRVGEKF